MERREGILASGHFLSVRFLGCVSAQGGNNVCVCSFEKFLVLVSGVSSVCVRPRGPSALCSVPLCARCCAPRTGAVLYTGQDAAIRTKQEFVQPVCCLVLSAAGQMGGTFYHPVMGGGPVYQSCTNPAHLLCSSRRARKNIGECCSFSRF